MEKFGTTSLVNTTWADTQDTVNTKRDTKSNDKIDVDYFRCVHIFISFLTKFMCQINYCFSQTKTSLRLSEPSSSLHLLFACPNLRLSLCITEFITLNHILILNASTPARPMGLGKNNVIVNQLFDMWCYVQVGSILLNKSF